MISTVKVGATAKGEIDKLTAKVNCWRNNAEKNGHEEASNANKE